MKFGHFSDTAREYVITTPRTPLPWINYLGSEAFFSLVSHTAGGYSFYRDAKLRRITRYRYNNVPADSNGRYYYIKDGDTVWNPGWQPTQTELDSYECRHGLGYSIITGKKNSLTAKLELFVPVGDNCEIDRLVLTNESDVPKSFTIFSYLEFCLWNAVDDSTNFQRNFSTGEVEVEGSTIYHKTEYRERRNHYALFTVNTPIDGFDTSRDAFLGAWHSNANPEVVENGRCTNSVAHGWAPVGVHQVNVTLQPGESRSLIFVLGYIENPEDEKWAAPGVINKTRAQAMAARYATDAQVDAALARLHDHWNNLLSTYSVKSSDEKLDRMVNTWNQYQCMVTFNMSRSASYYESGARHCFYFLHQLHALFSYQRFPSGNPVMRDAKPSRGVHNLQHLFDGKRRILFRLLQCTARRTLRHTVPASQIARVRDGNPQVIYRSAILILHRLSSFSKTAVREGADLAVQAETALAKTGQLLRCHLIICNEARQDKIENRPFRIHDASRQADDRCSVFGIRQKEHGSRQHRRAVGNDAYSGIFDRQRRLVVRIHTHSSGAEDKIGTRFHRAAASVCDLRCIIIVNLMKDHLRTEFCQLFLDNRCEGVLDPMVIHFISRCQNRKFFLVERL